MYVCIDGWMYVFANVVGYLKVKGNPVDLSMRNGQLYHVI